MMPDLDARLDTYSPVVLSLFRIFFGLLYLMNGTQKLFDFPIPASAPVPVGSWPYWWAGIIETVVGILITTGLFTRLAAFIAAGEMAVAYAWQHLPQGWWPIGNGGQLAVLFFFAFLLLATIGGGTYRVGALRGRMRR